MIHWHADFETGHAAIDAEHREFMRQLDVVEVALAAGQEQRSIAALLITLEKYALHHFAHEEALMLRTRCPAHATNARAHQDFTIKLAGWITTLKTDRNHAALAADIHREATAWIQSHILSVDCHLRGCSEARPCLIRGVKARTH